MPWHMVRVGSSKECSANEQGEEADAPGGFDGGSTACVVAGLCSVSRGDGVGVMSRRSTVFGSLSKEK